MITMDPRYIVVQYNRILHTAQQSRFQSFGYSTRLKKDALSTSELYVYSVSDLEKSDCDISGAYYIRNK